MRLRGNLVQFPYHPACRAATLVLVAICLAFHSVSAQSSSCNDLDFDSYLAGPGCTSQPLDCNDHNDDIHPGSIETCNGWDDDCDGEIDEGCNRDCSSFDLTNQISLHRPASRGLLAAADRGWAVVIDESIDGIGYVSTRLDHRGQMLVPQTYFTNTAGFVELVWTGSEMAASWGQAAYPGDRGQFLIRLGPWGTSPSEATQLTTDNSQNARLVWNGYEYGLLWKDVLPFPAADGTLFSRVDPDGLVTGDNIYLSDDILHGSLAWGGDGYAWAYGSPESTGHTEVSVQILDSYGYAAGPPTMLTDHSEEEEGTSAERPEIAAEGTGGGYGVLWRDDRTGTRQIYFARVAHDGTLLTPPGGVQVSSVTTNDHFAYDLAWNGAEYMAVWVNLDDGGPNRGGRITGSRISTAGVVLETSPITAGPDDNYPRVAWNGRSYGVVFKHYLSSSGPGSVEFGIVGCRCTTDADSDGIFPCSGGDCDDTDPTIGSGLDEICTDGKDNTCNGLIDCNDPSCVQGGNPPSDIGDLLWDADKNTIRWSGNSKATGYDIARGLLSDLQDMQTFLWADCFDSNTPETSTSDASIPLIGTAYYYVVRGRARTCLLGDWGTQLRNDTLHGCP